MKAMKQGVHRKVCILKNIKTKIATETQRAQRTAFLFLIFFK